MKQVERKIIFQCRSGSHLHGTNRPDSDEDFMGVFLPSTQDLFSLQNCPTEWTMNDKKSTGDRNTVGDKDIKYYSLQRFLQLAGEGQPTQLEMLFAPNESIIVSTKEWDYIKSNIYLFLSSTSSLPFIGFATSQSYKAVFKGENLNLIRNIITFLEELLNNKNSKYKLYHTINTIQNFNKSFNLKEEIDKDGIKLVIIGGRKYQETLKIVDLLKSLKKLENKYGTRSENASKSGYDHKSLTHAFRLIFEIKELLTEGKITLPRPKEEVKFLLSIRNGDYIGNFHKELEDKLTELRELKDKSSLPNIINWSKINRLNMEMLYEHISS